MGTLEVRNLVKEFRLGHGLRRSRLRAVDDVSFTLEAGKPVALVGESGSGKSTVARTLARLETPTSGEILLDGRSVSGSRSALRAYRHDVQMVFQDPFASLTPAEAYGAKRPHEVSGGQRQRVAIARALAPGARFLVADEPVSMLDVSIRLGVLNLLARLQREENLGVLYITHDLATARHFSDEILVMYRGQVVERGPSDQVILDPQHDYTKTLLAAAPDPARHGRLRDEVRAELAGERA